MGGRRIDEDENLLIDELDNSNFSGGEFQRRNQNISNIEDDFGGNVKNLVVGEDDEEFQIDAEIGKEMRDIE